MKKHHAPSSRSRSGFEVTVPGGTVVEEAFR
jgi:hypothetical protein